MIKGLKINKLYGRFNYDFITKEDGVTIITGPNGFGKSTILKIIAAASERNIIYFTEFEFESIVFEFENGKKMTLNKSDDELSIDNVSVNIDIFRSMVLKLVRPARRVRTGNVAIWDDNNWKYFSEDEFIINSLNEMDVAQRRIMLSESSETMSILDFIDKLILLSQLTGEIKMISDQRLIRMRNFETNTRDETNSYEVILDLQNDLREIIDDVSSRYSAKASELDSNYPNRLLASTETIDERLYIENMQKASEMFSELKKYNLAEISLIEGGIFKSNFATALKIYFDDFTEKYKVFEDLIRRLELFTSILNARLKFKKVEISRERGFLVKDTEYENRVLTLDKLSSGEKHEIILFFDLIFKTNKELLLLIDEPELSLHVTWQRQFLDDLLDVTKMNKTHVILATHSPQIIGNHRELQIDLGELYHES